MRRVNLDAATASNAVVTRTAQFPRNICPASALTPAAAACGYGKGHVPVSHGAWLLTSAVLANVCLVNDRRDRAVVARIAAHESWARTPDRSARTAPAREAALARFEEQVDPERKLAPDVRAQLAESARRAYFSRLARRSVQVRRNRRLNRAAHVEDPAAG
jgi:hypothetical protein